MILHYITFVGANCKLKELHDYFLKQVNQSQLIDAATTENIRWHFIPPHAPHFGEIWEASIKAIIYHLKRVVGNAK